jgi:hypothetical protein
MKDRNKRTFVTFDIDSNRYAIDCDNMDNAESVANTLKGYDRVKNIRFNQRGRVKGCELDSTCWQELVEYEMR